MGIPDPAFRARVRVPLFAPSVPDACHDTFCHNCNKLLVRTTRPADESSLLRRAIPTPRKVDPMTTKKAPRKDPPRVLIEEWLPAAAIGVECMRERGSASALAPTTYLHVWWARRPLCVSRAAVLASLLPADFPRDVFERLLGFGKPGKELVKIRALMDRGVQVDGGFGCDRAFKANLIPEDLDLAHRQPKRLWGGDITVMDPMSGGGSIPLESARLGFHTLANEYNPVACSVLEATVDYPIRFGPQLAQLSKKWTQIWIDRIGRRLAPFYPKDPKGSVHAYIYCRTVPCPDTGFHTPLVPDWHLARPTNGKPVVAAEPIVNRQQGTWSIKIREIGAYAGQAKQANQPTYVRGKGISLFTGRPIAPDYIKAKAATGKIKSCLYAVAVKTASGLIFRPPTNSDLDAIIQSERELNRIWSGLQKNGLVPFQTLPKGFNTKQIMNFGVAAWDQMFSPRQLLCACVLVEELNKMKSDIERAEGSDFGPAVFHLLALALDKFLDYNNMLNTWENQRCIVKHLFQRHDYCFKATYAELVACNSGSGLSWAINNSLDGFADLSSLSRSHVSRPAVVSKGTVGLLKNPPRAHDSC